MNAFSRRLTYTILTSLSGYLKKTDVPKDIPASWVDGAPFPFQSIRDRLVDGYRWRSQFSSVVLCRQRYIQGHRQASDGALGYASGLMSRLIV